MSRGMLSGNRRRHARRLGDALLDEWIIEDSEWKRELVVETSLETTPGTPEFDRRAIEETVSGAVHGLNGSEHHRIRIIPSKGSSRLRGGVAV
jgi:hypothetical protein